MTPWVRPPRGSSPFRLKPESDSMTERKPSSKGKAARREKGNLKSIPLTWRGVKLTLSGAFPEKAFAQYTFDSAMQGPNDSPAVLRFVVALLGEEQALKVREALTAVDDIGDLIETVLGKYGMSLGESGASQES